jgi:hypothetical protein
MKRQRILTACILAALTVMIIAPAQLAAEQAIGGSFDNSQAIEQLGNNAQDPNGNTIQQTAGQQGDFYVPDGVTPLDGIILPDWRGGDRVVWPILIKIILKHKLSNFRELSK